MKVTWEPDPFFRKSERAYIRAEGKVFRTAAGVESAAQPEPEAVAAPSEGHVGLGHKALAAAHAVQAEEEEVQSQQVAKMAADAADQHSRDMAAVVESVKAIAERPIVVNVAAAPAPNVTVNVPKQAAPVVHVAAPPAPSVTFEAPAPTAPKPTLIRKVVTRARAATDLPGEPNTGPILETRDEEIT